MDWNRFWAWMIGGAGAALGVAIVALLLGFFGLSILG